MAQKFVYSHVITPFRYMPRDHPDVLKPDSHAASSSAAVQFSSPPQPCDRYDDDGSYSPPDPENAPEDSGPENPWRYIEPEDTERHHPTVRPDHGTVPIQAPPTGGATGAGTPGEEPCGEATSPRTFQGLQAEGAILGCSWMHPRDAETILAGSQASGVGSSRARSMVLHRAGAVEGGGVGTEGDVLSMSDKPSEDHPPGHDTVLSQGQHKGLTYLQVVNKFPEYVEWIRIPTNPSRCLRDFVEWFDKYYIDLGDGPVRRRSGNDCSNNVGQWSGNNRSTAAGSREHPFQPG